MKHSDTFRYTFLIQYIAKLSTVYSI